MYSSDDLVLITIRWYLGIIYKGVYVDYVEVGLCIGFQTT